MFLEMAADICYVVYHPWESEDNSNRALAEIVSWQPIDIRFHYPLVGYTIMAELKIKGPLKYAEISLMLNDHMSVANAYLIAPIMSRFGRVPQRNSTCILIPMSRILLARFQSDA